MIKRFYDPSLPYKYVVYLRMSSEEQNSRSPDQQVRCIEETIRRLGLPWRRIGTYRDEAISGRYLAKRPEFQRMLHDIRLGRIQPDLIAIDVRNRLGRVDGLIGIQHELETEYGVLIVNAKSNFADPTTAVGRLTAASDNTMLLRDDDEPRSKEN